MPYALCPMPYAHEYLIFRSKGYILFMSITPVYPSIKTLDFPCYAGLPKIIGHSVPLDTPQVQTVTARQENRFRHLGLETATDSSAYMP